MRRLLLGALGVGIAVCFAGSPADAPAQGVPACAPGSELGVTLKAEERGGQGAAVATHEILVEADFTGDARRVSLMPPPGVPTIGRASGNPIAVVAPNASSVTVTVTWRQASDPSNPDHDPEDPATSCTASRDVAVALLTANPSRAVKHAQWRTLQRFGFTDVGIVPARRQPDLSPFQVSARTTSKVAFPPPGAPVRTMPVPLRAADKIRYRTRLPGLANATVAQQCRFYYLACATPFAPGGAFVEVGSIDDGVNGSLTRLARSQPFRAHAPRGILVEARPGGVRLGRPRPFGYDVQVRQSGRLVARVRMAGRCFERRRPQGLVTECQIARRSAQLR